MGPFNRLQWVNIVFYTLVGANAIIVISAAIIASVLLDHDIDELTITGDIKAGLPGIKLPSFTFDHPGNNGTESGAIHKDFGEVLAVSQLTIIYIFFYKTSEI